jgi:hypothetical protein
MLCYAIDSMRFRKLIRATENKYNRLLTSLSLIYLISPFLIDRPIGDFIVSFVFWLSLILVVYQIERDKPALKVHLDLVLLALLLRLLRYFSLIPSRFHLWLELSSTLIFLAFISLSVYAILRDLIPTEQVTSDIIKGGICVYFLFGFFWASMYNIVDIFDTDAFNAASTNVTRADLVHFSFTTLTTIGYGDISPASNVARVLANLEGMVGVLYPSVFIARLVGLQGGR